MLKLRNITRCTFGMCLRLTLLLYFIDDHYDGTWSAKYLFRCIRFYAIHNIAFGGEIDAFDAHLGHFGVSPLDAGPSGKLEPFIIPQ